MNSQIQAAVNSLVRSGHSVFVSPQNLIEFWNVWTRPLAKNGFGHTPADATSAVDVILDHFWLAEDTPAIFDEWLRLVSETGVSGVKVHDARIVAVMSAHNLTHLLTLNPLVFTRFTSVTVIEPASLVEGGA